MFWNGFGTDHTIENFDHSNTAMKIQRYVTPYRVSTWETGNFLILANEKL